MNSPLKICFVSFRFVSFRFAKYHKPNWNRVQNPDSSLIMHDFDLTDELSLKIELHMLRPITEKVHSGNGRVSLVMGAGLRLTKKKI